MNRGAHSPSDTEESNSCLNNEDTTSRRDSTDNRIACEISGVFTTLQQPPSSVFSSSASRTLSLLRSIRLNISRNSRGNSPQRFTHLHRHSSSASAFIEYRPLADQQANTQGNRPATYSDVDRSAERATEFAHTVRTAVCRVRFGRKGVRIHLAPARRCERTRCGIKPD